MRRKYTLIVVSVVAAIAAVVAVVSAGDSDNPPGPPETTSSYTLEDIYDRLDTGAAGTPITFTEPSSGPPTGTMHTLDEIYDLIGKRAPVPKTGQTDCYYDDGTLGTCTCGTANCPAGQDGDLEMGVAWITSTRFITGTTGVVTDTLTGLVWLQDANCIANEYPSFDADGRVTWSQALSFVAGITATGSYSNCAAGFGDWRLPNVRELQSLIDYGEDWPALPDGHPFTGVWSSYYWSSTAFAINSSPSTSWYVSLIDGFVNDADMGDSYYVWPVRGGQ